MNIEVLSPMIEIDIDAYEDLSFNYYCEICCTEFSVQQTKYECENAMCNQKMCDSCYEAWVKTKYENKCVYCRSPLEITIDYNEDSVSMDDTNIHIENVNVNRIRPCYGIICSVSYFGTSYLLGWIITNRTDGIFTIINFIIGMLITLMAWTFCIAPSIRE
tara:strand:+ start:5684 stop:6166 length:483 start_codon:yes stop_codon:yes gene_type:complete